MQKHYLTFAFLIFAVVAYSQTDTTQTKSQIDTTINLNLLRAPVSPASNLLGISPNEIQRPTDVKAFMVSIQNASQGFSAVPSSFGVDIAPYWFSRKKYTFSEQITKPQKLLQSLVLSAAVRNYQSKTKVDSTIQVGIGFRIALIRGNYKLEDVRNVVEIFENYRKALDDKLTADATYQNLKRERNSFAALDAEEARSTDIARSDPNSPKRMALATQIVIKEQALADRNEELRNTLTEEVKEFTNARLVRTGFKVDLAGGLAWDFADTRFGNGKVFKAGIWLTSGWEFKSGHAFLGILRYLNNPDKVFADDKGVLRRTSVNTYDYGIRYNFQGRGNPFTFSSEFLFRGVATQEIENSWRLVANASYEVSKNTILTLSLGRDFDKTFKKDGNVIAFLNFVKGFGF